MKTNIYIHGCLDIEKKSNFKNLLESLSPFKITDKNFDTIPANIDTTIEIIRSLDPGCHLEFSSEEEIHDDVISIIQDHCQKSGLNYLILHHYKDSDVYSFACGQNSNMPHPVFFETIDGAAVIPANDVATKYADPDFINHVSLVQAVSNLTPLTVPLAALNN